MNKTHQYTVGSLFAGVGGICQGFRDAGCKVIWANELDDNARKTYRANHPTVPFTKKNDVSELTSENIEAIDILTAGFPCQPFSHAGQAKGFNDPRGQLFYEVTRLLRELTPKAFFLENVKTLATHDRGASFKLVADEIKSTGYSLIPFLLKANEHTDVPQGRERLFLVGFREEEVFHSDRPILTTSNLRHPKAPLSSSFNIPTASSQSPRPLSDFLDPSTADPSDFYNDPDNIIHQRIRRDVVKPGIVYQYRRWFVRENKSNVCPTLTANMGLGGHNVPIVLDEPVPRRLSPKECFNHQGFQSDFQSLRKGH